MNELTFQEIHLSDYLNILRRRWIILTAALLVALYFFWFPVLRLLPMYRTTCALQLEEDKGLGRGWASNIPEFLWYERWMNNQTIVLKSRSIAEKVVQKLALRLQMKPKERVYQIFFRDLLQSIKANPLGDLLPQRWMAWLQQIEGQISTSPIFIRALRVEEGAPIGLYRVEFHDTLRFDLIGPRGHRYGQGEVGKPFPGPHFSFVVEGRGQRGRVCEFEVFSEDQAISSLQSSISVTAEKDSNLIHLAVKWNEPQMAGEVANAILDVYQETLVAKKSRDISQVLNYVESQLKISDDNLRKAEDELRQLKGRERVFDLETQLKNSIAQYSQYEKELHSLSLYRNQAEGILESLKSSKPFSARGTLFSLGAALNDQGITTWSQKLSDIMARREALLSLYTEEHPKVQQLDGEFEGLKKNIIIGIEGLISTLRLKERSLQAILKKLEKRVQQIPALEQEFYSLQRVVRAGQQVNDFLLQKHAELSVNRASVLPNVFVLERASRLGTYIGPNVERKLLWALLIGLALGIGLTFLVEYFDTSIKSPDQVQKVTGLPFLGSIHHFVRSRKTGQDELPMLSAPYSHVAEAFRTIKTNMIFAASVQGLKKLLLITSSTPSEGKTFVSANLGVAFAQSGKRTLLVEADLRKPSLHPLFGIEKSPGLTNILIEAEIDFPKLPIRRTEVPNLHLLPSGDNPPNPSELLCSDKMDELFVTLRNHYDFVLFDSPPVFLTSDPIILAQRLDGVILVTRAEETKRELLRESVERLLRVDAKILGVILNDLSTQSKRYYEKKYRYYYTPEGVRKKKKR